MKTALVCGAGGFIGGHLVRRLKAEGFWVRGVDLKYNEYAETEADDYFCLLVSDANLSRYGVDPAEFGAELARGAPDVNAFALFIARLLCFLFFVLGLFIVTVSHLQF